MALFTCPYIADAASAVPIPMTVQGSQQEKRRGAVKCITEFEIKIYGRLRDLGSRLLNDRRQVLVLRSSSLSSLGFVCLLGCWLGISSVAQAFPLSFGTFWQQRQRVFVTTTSYTGNIGGLSGADAACQARANSAALGGQWKAILSDSALSAANRIEANGLIFNMRPGGSGGPQLVATKKSDLFSNVIRNTISYGENGSTQSGNVWSNTVGSGAVYSASYSCSNWTSTAANGRFGISTDTGSTWISSDWGGCTASYRLYCIDGQNLPNSPLSLGSSPVTGLKMDLGWTVNSNNSDQFDDTGFRIYRSTDGTNFSVVATTAAHASTYQDSGLTDAVIYYYRVLAIRTISGVTFESPVSNTTSATAYASLHRTFVTTTSYSGNFGGIHGADAACQARATAASLGTGWKAVLSNSGDISAAGHLTINGPVFNLRPFSAGGALQVAANSAGFWSGTHSNAINYGQDGSTQSGNVWSNTLGSGAVYSASYSCSNWTSTAANGRFGISSDTGSTWISSDWGSCTPSYRLYCIDGQATPNPPSSLGISPVTGGKMNLGWTVNSNNADSYDDTGFRIYRSTDNVSFSLIATTAAHAATFQDTGLTNATLYYYRVTAVLVGGSTYESVASNTVSATAYTTLHRIFVTTAAYNGNIGGLAGADSACQTAGTSLGGTWKAVLSGSTTSAASRLTINGPVFNLRPISAGSAQQIAANSAGFWSGTISNPIQYGENGSTQSGNVWSNTVGSGAVYSASYSCSNWTSTAANGRFGISTDTGSTWISSDWGGCTASYRLYCIDQ